MGWRRWNRAEGEEREKKRGIYEDEREGGKETEGWEGKIGESWMGEERKRKEQARAKGEGAQRTGEGWKREGKGVERMMSATRKGNAELPRLHPRYNHPTTAPVTNLPSWTIFYLPFSLSLSPSLEHESPLTYLRYSSTYRWIVLVIHVRLLSFLSKFHDKSTLPPLHFINRHSDLWMDRPR